MKALVDTIASLVPHTDSGFMTLLPPNKVQGLSILLPSGEWMDAPHVEGAFVVNGGDILHRWTNERFLSTPHRVRNVSGTVRYAIPFFFDPSHDSTIECLPTCHGPGNPPRYEPIICETYNQALVDQAARTGRPGLSKQTAARFRN